MRHFRFCVFLLLTLLLKSCAVPDVQPFTRATADVGLALKTSINYVNANFARVDSAVKLSGGQQLVFDRQRDTLKRISTAFAGVSAAFDGYAKALNKITDAHADRKRTVESVSKSIENLAKATQVLGGISSLAAVAAEPLAKLATDISAVHALGGLNKLVSPRQDSIIQHSTRVMKLGLREFARINADLNVLLRAGLPVAYDNTLHYYNSSLELQAAVVNQLQLLTNAEKYIITADVGRLPATVTKIIEFEGRTDAQELIKKANARVSKSANTRYAPLLAVIQQRKTFYQDLTALPQAQYDAAQAKLACYRRNQEQGTEAMQQSAQLLDVWARSHHELRQLLIKDNRITRQDLVDNAQEMQHLIAGIKASIK